MNLVTEADIEVLENGLYEGRDSWKKEANDWCGKFEELRRENEKYKKALQEILIVGERNTITLDHLKAKFIAKAALEEGRA